jgi:hypothetical protein
MLEDIDGACKQAGIMPDMFLAAHAHSYQRYTRRVTINGKHMEIPFIVAGMGGRNDQAVNAASGQLEGDHTFVGSRKGFGYATVEANAQTIMFKSIGVDQNSGVKSVVDRVSVNLATNAVS